MKAPFAKLLPVFIIIFIFGCYTNVCAQADSVRITYSSENSDSSDYNYHRKYQYLDINLKDETKLIKIGIPSFGVNYSKSTLTSSTIENFGLLFFTFEKKINPFLSLIIQNDNNLSKTTTPNTSTNWILLTETTPVSVFNSNIDWGIRYYFFMKEKIREGISGNNCNGIYVDFFLKNLNQFQFQHVRFTSQNYYDIKVNYYNYSHLWNKAPTYNFNIGLQKRLNKFSFIDASFLVQYTPEGTSEQKIVTEYSGYNFKVTTQQNTTASHLNFGLDIIIGLAWGWK